MRNLMKERGRMTAIYKDIAFASADVLVNAGNGTGYMGGKQSKEHLCSGVAEHLNYYSNGKAEKAAKEKKRFEHELFAFPVGSVFYTDNCGFLCKVILHAVTMRHAGGHSTYRGIEKCIKNIYDYCEKTCTASVAIPLLGCGTGGLDAERIRTMIDEEARRHPSIATYLYVPRYTVVKEQDGLFLIKKYGRFYLRFMLKQNGEQHYCDIALTDSEANLTLKTNKKLIDFLQELHFTRKNISWDFKYFMDTALLDCMCNEENYPEEIAYAFLKLLDQSPDIKNELYDTIMTNGRTVPDNAVTATPTRRLSYPQNALYFTKAGYCSDFRAYLHLMLTRNGISRASLAKYA